MELNASESEFSTQFSRVLTFLQITFTFSYLGPHPIVLLVPCKQPAFYHVFRKKRAKFRLATINKDALFEILSFSLVQCICAYSRSQHIFG